MKTFSLTDKLNFGKHQGKTIGETLRFYPEYLCWCLANLDHFMVDAEVWESLGIENISNDVVNGAKEAYARKLDQNSRQENLIVDPEDLEREEEDDWDEYEPGIRSEPYGESYEEYGGYNGYSDDVIDDAFNGEPENTWNVD